MTVVTKLVLPPDVIVAPVANLSAKLRQELMNAADDFHVTRPNTRTESIIVGMQTAMLLECFRRPATVVDAVIEFSTTHALDPLNTLDRAFETLKILVSEGILVPAESGLAKPIVSLLEAGALLNNIEIVESIYLLDDTEIYRGRTQDGIDVALKVSGRSANKHIIAAIHHEANILTRLDGKINPCLCAAGNFDGRAFIVTTWHCGVDLYHAAKEARALPEIECRDTLLNIAENILRAYIHLHAQDVLHGDIHPRNILVDARNVVTIIDYGFATMPVAGLAGLHGGIDLFRAPEIAVQSHLPASKQLVPSVHSEQYSIGALLYLLFTGGHTHAFSLQRDVMIAQLLNDPPLPFRDHGVKNLTAVEICISRAIAKNPEHRYSSITKMLEAFLLAVASDRAICLKSSIQSSTTSDKLQVLLHDAIKRVHIPGFLYSQGLEPPTASIIYGGAGIAYFLLRVARSQEDQKLLANADIWATHAAINVSTHNAFWNSQRGIVQEVFGQSSLFHHASGVHCVQALIAHARNDDHGQQVAVEAFISAGELCDQIDIAFGKSGLLIGCTILFNVMPLHIDSTALLAFGQKLLQDIWLILDNQPPLREGTQMTTLGAAHGWCGYLFATMQWCEASGTVVPSQLEERLQQLAELSQPVGRSLNWARKLGDVGNNSMLAASWCNGAAGYVYLWTMASQLLGYDERYERLAHMAAWHAYQGSSDAVGNLCCGLAGRAYALLSLYKQTGELPWLERARILAIRAASNPKIEHNLCNSLYHGDIGIAMLALDLGSPNFSCMPFFESERWP